MDFVAFCRYLRRQEGRREFATCSHGFLDCKICDRMKREGITQQDIAETMPPRYPEFR